MADKFCALTVVLENDMTPEEVKDLAHKIKGFRGVLKVTEHAADASTQAGYERARKEIIDDIMPALLKRFQRGKEEQ